LVVDNVRFRDRPTRVKRPDPPVVRETHLTRDAAADRTPERVDAAFVRRSLQVTAILAGAACASSMLTAVLLLVAVRQFARQRTEAVSQPPPSLVAPAAAEPTNTQSGQKPENVEHGYLQEIFRENLDLLDQEVVTNAA
jgi:hypothetical protein